MDYEEIIHERFQKCNVEIITPDFFKPDQLIEYITDDITIYNPHLIIIYRHMIRFFVNVNEMGKIYYLENFTDDDLEKIYNGLNKFNWRGNIKINILPDADPDRDILGL